VTPFSERVTAAEWRAEADAWITERLAAADLTVTATIEQRRVRPWSTQLVVPTEAGTVWFKANCPAQGFEPSLQALLARLAPGEVDEPLAVDAERCWMLTRDRGPTLRERHEPGLADWEAVLRESARLQRLVADRGREVLATGVPDCAPSTVAARFESMLAHLRDRADDDAAHLPVDVVEQLESAAPAVRDAARVLVEGPLPATLQHGDLHPGNVFSVDGRLRVFDFGDAQWADPLESLPLPWAMTKDDDALPWDDLLAAYHAPWADLLTLDELRELLAAAVVTQPVNRSFGWWEALAEASEEEWSEWGEAPSRHLAHVVEQWP
jgi:hypothetical protein